MSRAPVLERMPDELVRHLAGGRLCVVATVDPDGRPATTLMSWVVARSGEQLALGVDARSRTFQNLVRSPAVAVEALGDGLSYGIKGRATVERERMSEPPFPCALVVIEVDEVRDHQSPGTVLAGPRYSYSDDKQHRLELEERLFAELRGAGQAGGASPAPAR